MSTLCLETAAVRIRLRYVRLIKQSKPYLDFDEIRNIPMIQYMSKTFLSSPKTSWGAQG